MFNFVENLPLKSLNEIIVTDFKQQNLLVDYIASKPTKKDYPLEFSEITEFSNLKPEEKQEKVVKAYMFAIQSFFSLAHLNYRRKIFCCNVRSDRIWLD